MADTHGEPCWACTPRAPRFILHTNSASPLWKALRENALWQPGRPSSPGVWGGVLLLALTPPRSARPRLGCRPWGFCHPSGAHFTGEDGEAEARVRVGDGEPRPFSRSLGSCDPGSEHRGHRSLPAASCRPGRERTEPGAGCSQSISARKSPPPGTQAPVQHPPRPDLWRTAHSSVPTARQRARQESKCQEAGVSGCLPREAKHRPAGRGPAGVRWGASSRQGGEGEMRSARAPCPLTSLSFPPSLSLSVTTCW